MLLRRVPRNGIAGGETPLTRVDLPWFFGAIVSGGVVAPVLLLFGLQQTTSSSASLLLNLEGVFTVLLAWIFFKENIDRKVGLGIIVVLVGSVLISWQPTAAGNVSLGALAIIAACLCWGLDNNLTQRVSARDPREVAGAKGLLAGTVNISIGILLGAPLPTVAWASTTLTVGFFTYGISLAFYVQSLRTLGAARTSAYFCIGPFVGAFVGLVLWHESPLSIFTMATISMVAGVFLLVSERHGHMHFHDSLIHSHRHIHDDHHHHTHSRSDSAGNHTLIRINIPHSYTLTSITQTFTITMPTIRSRTRMYTHVSHPPTARASGM